MASTTTLSEVKSEYVQVGALQMYCETQGHGRPLLLLHAGFATIETSFEMSRPVLAKRWTTIAVEQQGHGHTADIDRPPTYEQMVEDTAALLRQKEIVGADVFGWSNGRLAILPGSDHSAPVTRSDWVTAMLIEFFDAP
jgi:pimeloyl-ACP methyl ester carboxylesterase